MVNRVSASICRPLNVNFFIGRCRASRQKITKNIFAHIKPVHQDKANGLFQDKLFILPLFMPGKANNIFVLLPRSQNC
jgi:hypothetical protein